MIGYTYGSEWHLLRFRGYHREYLNRAIEAEIPGGKVLRWLDLPFKTDMLPPDPGCSSRDPVCSGRRPRPRSLENEFKAIGFLAPKDLERVQGDWMKYWPQTGTPPHWDSVAEVEIDGTTHWLLVEAKSHLNEVIGFCGAKGSSLDTILAAFASTIHHTDAKVNANDWLGPYYQFCNRLAVLSFLREHAIPAKLLFLYFLGDMFPAGRNQVLPTDQQAWLPLLKTIENHVGWNDTNPLARDVHKLFLPVCPPSGA